MCNAIPTLELAMDDARFDALARSLTKVRSRRGLGRLVGALALGGSTTAGVAAKKKRKRKKKKKKPPLQVVSPLALPPPPTCSDGIKNGTETDIDCGGRCPRCPNGKTCTSRNDCATAYCSENTCKNCVLDLQCGAPDRNCVCGQSANGTVCLAFIEQAINCISCPRGAVACLELSPTRVNCYKLCGATGDPGQTCSSDEQCLTGNCVDGACSRCATTQDFCQNGDNVCGIDGGACLKSAGGPVRCGRQPQEPGFSCGDCTTDAECQERHGSDGKTYFCALDTGPNCTCPAASPRFCVVSKERMLF
jgi:hypothetical protein